MSAMKEHVSTRRRLPVNPRGLALLALSFKALGIIYSDIGTSPLYVLNGIWPAAGEVPPAEDVVGGISAIIWALTFLPLLKYVFFTLRFGTHEGEGGTFALFQGLFPPQDKDFDADRTLTGDSHKQNPNDSAKLSPKLRWPLLIWALFGTSLTLADGVFTPAVSVTSAVAGIGVAKPSITQNVAPISIAILIVLFLVQFRGTNFISFIFAPVTFIWMALLACTGIMNIIAHPAIFRAFDPSRAILLFVRTGNYDLLAGILLAVTGCEAIFANLGQFNAGSIQLSFACLVYPSLVLAYLGQGARLIRDGESVLPNIFYNTIPGPVNGGLYWVMFVFATLATVIASQAMITATFSLTQQLVNMRSLPPIRMTYTSKTIQGQVYVPIVNYVVLILTIVVVVAFKDPARLTNAYGFAVATVMFATTVLISLQIKYVKGLSIFFALAFLVFFGFIDGLFWGAALKKIPEGAWVPLMIGGILLIIMAFWTWARSLEDDFDGNNRRNLRHIIVRRDVDNALEVAISPRDNEDNGSLNSEKKSKYYVMEEDYTPHHGGNGEVESETSEIGLKVLARIPSCAVFHKLSTGPGVPHSFVSFFRQWPALPRVVIFLSVRVLPIAYVDPEERYIVNKVRTIEGFYGVTYHIGFRDTFDVDVDAIIRQVADIEARNDPRTAANIIREIKEVSVSSTHIVPHYVVTSKPIQGGKLAFMGNIIRRFFIEDIYRTISTMFPETANWSGSPDRIIHVGINATI
ncbi:potassium transporter [Cristinia sonorae]|uniref:Potassium transporter n=1 Tax=Cristinia sonorae TaxID=1940300 RepID=A0A8K0XLS5_9AGAR|nr:potassium transporter [Cristinia sonorae]